MIPASESLKDVVERTKPFWNEVIVPRLRRDKKILIVGHENNLRSILKVLDRIPEDDIIHVDIPRSIPLVYHLDPVTLTPIGTRDKETLLTGKYLGSKEAIQSLKERDMIQVYDLNVKENLEMVFQPPSSLKFDAFLNIYISFLHVIFKCSLPPGP